MKQRSVFLAVDRQVGPLIRKAGGDILPDINPKTSYIPGIHKALLEGISMRKSLLRLGVMQHVLLHPEIIDGDIQMQRRTHAHRRHVARSMATRLHMVK